MRRFKSAFTLVEVLVCLAILTILLAIVIGVFRQALGDGKLGMEIEQMHQLGLAGNIYHEQYDAWPQNSTALVNSKMAPREICKSPRDPYADGYSNEFLKQYAQGRGTYAQMIAKFPNTYLSLGDIWMFQHNAGEVNRMLSEQDNPGLFVSLIDSVPAQPGTFSAPFKGRYRRVLLDGSVVIREPQEFRGVDEQGNLLKASSDSAFFFDPTEAWVRDFMRTMGAR